MTCKFLRIPFAALSAVLCLVSCGAVPLVSTPIALVDPIPLKVSELTDIEKKTWNHANLITDTIPGMSVDKAYKELLKNRKGETVVVAVLDAGVDLEHEDLDDVLWRNTKEIRNNGKDDDGNGYVDDVHGYNFLGESYNEQMEYVRMLRLNIGDASVKAKAQRMLDEEYPNALQSQKQYEFMFQTLTRADNAVKEALGKEVYTKADLQAITPKTDTLRQYVALLTPMLAYGEKISTVLKEFGKAATYLSDQVNYNLNKTFNGRASVGDDPYDITDRAYGNGDPKNRTASESHGTHVAGIIAAERNNGKGINGVARNVQLMVIRVVPNGDEYDKDVALGIRYAVDNGAKIINCSFGKDFSPHAEWVYEAILYAASKDVLIVHAAGNDGADLDNPENPNFPNDHKLQNTEFADNVITVGALNSNYGSTLIAPFSNYGQRNVDLFAPGTNIYSTMPNNTYEFQGGTSMAAPAVSGVAALVRSQYPQLSAAHVKQILMQSGLPVKTPVIVGGDPSKSMRFDQLSKSGKMVNAYNALVLAEKVAKGKTDLVE